MARQVLIIGLGQFGMSVAKSLSEKGTEVLAVDRRRDRVDMAAAYADSALALDATDEDSLARLQPQQRDVAICAIGDDSREASIICTALLRQMGAPLIVARANDSVHRRILKLVGAHQVVNPEQEFGQRFANRIAYERVITDMPIGADLYITEVALPEKFAGRTLQDLELPKRFGVMVVAVRRGEQGKVLQPNPFDKLQPRDNLIVVSKEAAIKKLMSET